MTAAEIVPSLPTVLGENTQFDVDARTVGVPMYVNEFACELLTGARRGGGREGVVFFCVGKAVFKGAGQSLSMPQCAGCVGGDGGAAGLPPARPPQKNHRRPQTTQTTPPPWLPLLSFSTSASQG